MEHDPDRDTTEARLRAAYPDAEFLGRASLDPIVIVEYSAAWPGIFEAWRVRLSGALGAVARRVEHVGSTAVPGLAAKPVVDVQVSVPDVEDEPAYTPHIEALGLPLRVREPVRRYFRAPGKRRVVHVHVCGTGGVWEREHLLLRDYLRSHPHVAADYARLKLGLAERFSNDRLAYTEGKSAFIAAALADAELWADDTCWTVATA